MAAQRFMFVGFNPYPDTVLGRGLADVVGDLHCCSRFMKDDSSVFGVKL